MTVRTVAFLACAVLVLAGLWFFMRPGAQMPGQAADVQSFHFEVRQGEVIGPERMTLTQGFPVQLTLVSDQDDQMHLHGYELWTEVNAGQVASLAFPASYSGRFELELHEAELSLGFLDVYPYTP